eukprot:3441604-Pyramimonas_sp.AAC.1
MKAFLQSNLGREDAEDSDGEDEESMKAKQELEDSRDLNLELAAAGGWGTGGHAPIGKRRALFR